MNEYISEKIKKLEEYVPNETQYTIRLDANENPFPLPLDFKKRVAELITTIDLNRYPDPSAKKLITSFSQVYCLPDDHIVAGNGSDELISIICTAFLSKNDRVLFLAPDFSMYAFYSSLIEAEVLTYNKIQNQIIDFENLKKVVRENNIRMVIFSNPCNPTGIAYKNDVIADFITSVNCLCVVDEAYMEFSPHREAETLLFDIDKHQNLIILKTLSKAFGLAALRLGFAVSNKEIIQGIKKVKSPYNVNSVSQVIGTELLKSPEIIFEQAKMISYMTSEMRLKLSEYESFFGFKTYQTETNFNVLCFREKENSKKLFDQLCSYGIAVRHIMGNSLRITCGTENENCQLLKTLSEICDK